MALVTVILAAGYGTRMRSDLPKVLHPLAGRPLIDWVVQTAASLGDRKPVVVVGHGRGQVQALLGDRVEYAFQDELLGTGHALRQTAPLLRHQAGRVLVLYADMPLLRLPTLHSLLALATTGNPAIAMLTVVRDDPQGFGRVIRDELGRVRAIVEEVDCSPEQLAVRELNPGVYCFDATWLWQNLPLLQPSAKGEVYLTDLIGLAAGQGRPIATLPAPPAEVFGINDRTHLAVAARVLRLRIAERHMLAGVTIVDPETTYIDDTVQIGRDTVVLPGCQLTGATRIGAQGQIGPCCQIIDSTIGDRCRVTFSVVEGAGMEDGSDVGPFSHLRQGAHLGPDVHVGNFGEVKNSYLGPNSKMGHFSYLGDARLEGDVNVGAGTITCNFDGREKHKTAVGWNVFLGSDTLLVAPVRLGDGARTGAGSVVTRDVPEDTLVYGVPARPAPPKDE